MNYSTAILSPRSRIITTLRLDTHLIERLADVLTKVIRKYKIEY